jgi:hypothetical protein
MVRVLVTSPTLPDFEPLSRASILSAKASQRNSTGEDVFTEGRRDPSRWTCAERPTYLLAKTFS